MGKYQKTISYGVIAVALIIIAFYSYNPKQEPIPNVNLNKSQVSTSSSAYQAPADTKVDDKQKQLAPDDKSAPNSQLNKNKVAANSAPTTDNIAIKIPKNEVTSKAIFYPYNLDGTNMEIIAVKATDGTIRTSLNTCQVCYDSGRGYYVQQGDYLVCQNCGNRFHIDQIEKIKGGCNPVPILEESKQDVGTDIVISKDFIATQKQYFSNWKTS